MRADRFMKTVLDQIAERAEKAEFNLDPECHRQFERSYGGYEGHGKRTELLYSFEDIASVFATAWASADAYSRSDIPKLLAVARADIQIDWAVREMTLQNDSDAFYSAKSKFDKAKEQRRLALAPLLLPAEEERKG